MIERLYRDAAFPWSWVAQGLYVQDPPQGLVRGTTGDPRLCGRPCGRRRRTKGMIAFYARLVSADPVAAARLHPRDESKIIRALEVYQLSGVPMS